MRLEFFKEAIIKVKVLWLAIADYPDDGSRRFIGNIFIVTSCCVLPPRNM
jgi:hypothetical protein